MINLYAQNCTDFNNNGLATLTPMECTLTASINDVWKLEAKIPYDEDGKFNDVTYDCFLKVSGMNAIAEQSSAQIFRIYDVKKETDGVYILAYPVGLDARFDTFVDSLQLYYMTASQAISAINALSNKYTVTTDLVTTASAEYTNANIISILNGDNGFVNNWGGEICYDNYNIKVLGGLGSNSGMQFRYGKNLQSMDYEVESSNVITRLYPKSANGDILNAVNDYKIANQRYVDSSHFNNYPIPHIYYVATPYRLTQLNNDGSQEYNLSSTLYENIASTVSSAVLTLTDTAMKDGKNLDLAYIKSRFLLTTESDMTEGFAERIWRLVATSINFKSSEFSNLVRQAISEGFKRAGNSILTTMGWIGDSDFMAYTTAENGDYKRVNTWAKNGQKWWSIPSDGITGPGTIFPSDTAEWKWYKPKKKDFKRFGNKSKDKNGYYMHDSFYKVNDTLYYFKTTGEAVPYPQFHTYSIDGFVIAAMYDSIVTSLTSMLATSEGSFFNLLYTQMTNYCNDLYTKQEIDLPVVNIGVDLVDLSKTTEYAGYEGLLSVKLGDVVQCINPKMDLTTTERVVGIEYDVIRGFNNKVEVGTVKNSVVNLLNGIGSKKEDVKLVAGNNVTINNNVISVTPQPSVKDVRVNGQTVTYDGIANIDLDLDGNGLQWFSETENALFGTNDFLEFIKDRRYAFKPQDDKSVSMLGVVDSSWSYTEERQIIKPIFKTGANREKDYVFAFTPESTDDTYPLYIHSLQHDWSHGGMLLLTNNISAIDRINITRSWYNFNKNTGESSSNSYSGTVTVPPADETVYESELTDSDGHKSSTKYAKAIVTIDEVQWVAMWFWTYSLDYQTSSAASIETYLPASDIPLNGYDTLGDLARAVIPLWKVGDGTASGIARQNGLAFFAGADDDLGTNAPIKIFNDGTYQGLDKVEDVLVNGISVLHEKIADIDLSDYQKKSVHILQEDYNNLSDEQKKNGRIYFVYKYNYEFHESSDGTLVVRIGADGIKWFFRGYTKESGDVTPPNSLSSYVPSSLIMTSNYPEGGTSQNGWIGFYQNKIRSWTQSKTQTMAGTFYGVLDVNGVESQITPYYDPYDDATPIMISYMGVEYYVGGIADVEADGVSIVHQGVASITSGDNIQIKNGVISATDTTYSDFAGSTHGLVPPASSGDSGKFLKGDGTWANSTDLEPIELTKAEYDLLSQAEKEADDKVYFITDYNGMDLDIQVNGTSIISGGVADVTTEEVLNPSGLVGYVDVRSKPDMTDIDQNLTVLTQMNTFEFDFDYKFHRWISGGSAWLQEYNVNIDSRQGQVASSYKHSEWNNVAEGYEETHYTEESSRMSPGGVGCSQETFGDLNAETGLYQRGIGKYTSIGYEGLMIYQYDYENDEELEGLDISNTDITKLQGTWDGTNASLNDALAALSARITALGG